MKAQHKLILLKLTPREHALLTASKRDYSAFMHDSMTWETYVKAIAWQVRSKVKQIREQRIKEREAGGYE